MRNYDADQINTKHLRNCQMRIGNFKKAIALPYSKPLSNYKRYQHQIIFFLFCLVDEINWKTPEFVRVKIKTYRFC